MKSQATVICLSVVNTPPVVGTPSYHGAGKNLDPENPAEGHYSDLVIESPDDDGRLCLFPDNLLPESTEGNE